MSRPYTLHGDRLIGTCPICGGIENFYGEARKVDLPEHGRTQRGEILITAQQIERCPGSGISVQLKAPATSSETQTITAPSDDEPFPFGKHKTEGHAYGQVPASYYDFIAGLPWINKWPKVVAYIAKNRAGIDKDLEDAGKI